MANYFVFNNDHIFVCSPQHCCQSHTKRNVSQVFRMLEFPQDKLTLLLSDWYRLTLCGYHEWCRLDNLYLQWQVYSLWHNCLFFKENSFVVRLKFAFWMRLWVQSRLLFSPKAASWPFNDQWSHHIETNQLICSANQLTASYMIGTLVVKRLNTWDGSRNASVCIYFENFGDE